MKANRALILLAATWLAVSATSLRAEDWKTKDGIVYQDVKVVHTEPDAVTILHKDGGALVPLAKLSPELQQRFKYDPDKASAAADARTKDEAESAQALRLEEAQARQMRQAEAEAEQAAANAPSSTPDDSPSAPPAASDPTHHSVDEIAASAGTLHRDLSDPSYHTAAHLSYTMHSMAPDASDPNHHTISEITDSGL